MMKNTMRILIPILTLIGLSTAQAAYVPFPVNSKGSKEIIERARITLAGSATITAQSGTWITATNYIAAGVVDLTVAGFSATPSCTCSADTGGVLNTSTCVIVWANTNTTTVRVVTGNSTTGGTADFNFDLICMGPRP
jgi:hypothetical protein